MYDSPEDGIDVRFIWYGYNILNIMQDLTEYRMDVRFS